MHTPSIFIILRMTGKFYASTWFLGIDLWNLRKTSFVLFSNSHISPSISFLNVFMLPFSRSSKRVSEIHALINVLVFMLLFRRLFVYVRSSAYSLFCQRMSTTIVKFLPRFRRVLLYTQDSFCRSFVFFFSWNDEFFVVRSTGKKRFFSQFRKIAESGCV